MEDAPTSKSDPSLAPEANPPVPRRFASRDLFGGAREIVIDHDGRAYRMRITQNGKLILTA